MKLRTLFFLLFLPFVPFAQNATQISKRTQYYAAGMTASIKHFDSVLNIIIGNRYKAQLDETAFVKAYSFHENLYKQHQQKVSALAEKWSVLPKESSSKNINTVLRILSKGQVAVAIQTLESQLRKKTPNQKTARDFLFLAELYVLKGDYTNALSVYEKVALSPAASVADFLNVAETRNFIMTNEDKTPSWPESAKSDTIFLIKAKLVNSKKYSVQGNANEAKARLIEAQYLIERYTLKDDNLKDLSAIVSYQLANLQQESNDFENALNNSKASVEAYQARGNKPGLAATLRVQANIYRRAGANDKAETAYNECLKTYEQLMKENPERYQPLYAEVKDEYNEILKWYDRNDAYEESLRKLAILRKEMMQQNYPFFAIDYARTLDLLGQKLLDVNLKIFLAEEQWFSARDVLIALNEKNSMICGDYLCKILYKTGGVKVSLKEPKEAIPAFSQSLKVRENLFKLAPLKNKYELMNLLFQNAHLNNIGSNNFELAIVQLNQAKILADELGEVKMSEEITIYTVSVLKKM